jgi:hypothetical protein
MSTATRTDKRRETRKRLRIPCVLAIGEKQQSGFVLDLSLGGMFVHTTLIPPAGTRVRVSLLETASSPALSVEAVVARGRRVPPQLAALAGGGIGLRVIEATTEFEALCRVQPDGLGARPICAEPAARASENGARRPDGAITFRIRLVRHDGNRSRMVDVAGADEADAKRRALASAGAGWEVQEARRLAG